MFVKSHPMFPPAVFQKFVAVVGDDDDQRVLQQVPVPHSLEQSAETCVLVPDIFVVKTDDKVEILGRQGCFFEITCHRLFRVNGALIISVCIAMAGLLWRIIGGMRVHRMDVEEEALALQAVEVGKNLLVDLDCMSMVVELLSAVRHKLIEALIKPESRLKYIAIGDVGVCRPAAPAENLG